jgi:hypothetical protein
MQKIAFDYLKSAYDWDTYPMSPPRDPAEGKTTMNDHNKIHVIASTPRKMSHHGATMQAMRLPKGTLPRPSAVPGLLEIHKAVGGVPGTITKLRGRPHGLIQRGLVIVHNNNRGLYSLTEGACKLAEEIIASRVEIKAAKDYTHEKTIYVGKNPKRNRHAATLLALGLSEDELCFSELSLAEIAKTCSRAHPAPVELPSHPAGAIRRGQVIEHVTEGHPPESQSQRRYTVTGTGYKLATRILDAEPQIAAILAQIDEQRAVYEATGVDAKQRRGKPAAYSVTASAEVKP